jgi:pimeloyl-ACP methyl ester carboxylesterase
MDKRIPFGSSEIAYQVVGKGHPVIFLHGFAENGDVWKNQVNFLADKFRLIIPDIPGSGKSSYNKSLNTIDDFAELVKDLADAEQIKPFTLIGHSMGGYFALSFAEKYPEWLDGIGLFHSTAYSDTEEKKASRRKSIAFIREHGSDEFIGLSTPNLFADKFRESHPEIVDAFLKTLAGFSAEALIAYYEAMMIRPNRTHVLKQAQVPILFIAGEKDMTVPLQDSLQQCWLANRTQVHILKSSAHMGMLEEIPESNKAILEFLHQNSEQV